MSKLWFEDYAVSDPTHKIMLTYCSFNLLKNLKERDIQVWISLLLCYINFFQFCCACNSSAFNQPSDCLCSRRISHSLSSSWLDFRILKSRELLNWIGHAYWALVKTWLLHAETNPFSNCHGAIHAVPPNIWITIRDKIKDKKKTLDNQGSF